MDNVSPGGIPRETKKAVLAASGHKCAFPGCGAAMLDTNGTPFLELAHIKSLAQTPDLSRSDANAYDNLLILCPNHHRLVDSNPSEYPPSWLRNLKKSHELQVKAAINLGVDPIPVNKAVPQVFKEALAFWDKNKGNSREEDWQTFFHLHPQVIAQAVPNHILHVGSKCYVGGKDITNANGNLVDFLYASQSNRNITLAELKTPTMKLVGRQYRTNAYSMSEELSGSVVQALNYKYEIQRSLLSVQADGDRLEAFNPECLVIAGNLAGSSLDSNQRKSFGLFRAELTSVTIITFDELFGKVQDLVDMIG